MNANPINQILTEQAATEVANDNQILSKQDYINLDKLDPATLANNALGMVTSAYEEHNFLIEVLNNENKDDMSPEMLREIQNDLEKFTVQVQLISKTASIVLKDIDTLIKIQ